MLSVKISSVQTHYPSFPKLNVAAICVLLGDLKFGYAGCREYMDSHIV